MDEDEMIKQLPSTLKEEVLFHQYGSIIKTFKFFKDNLNNTFVWTTVKLLSKISYDQNEVIYNDNSISDSMFFIHKGIVKLYAENDFSFYIFKVSHEFGDNDMVLNQRRMGTAKTMINCQLYKITKNHLEQILEDYPSIRQDMIKQSKEKNMELIM